MKSVQTLEKRDDVIQQDLEWKQHIMLENADNVLMNQIIRDKAS